MSEDNYLHEAIIIVLRARGHSMTAQEIADEVNRRGLYTRGDGNPVPSKQIHARVNNYPGLFRKHDSLISLI